MSNSKLGSLWFKWDLHFHTPTSYDYENGSISNEQIVEALITAGIKVVAITDHHQMDINNIKEIRKISKGKLIILPGIELRSELGDKPIHYIGIFPEYKDIDHIWDTIKGTFKFKNFGGIR